MSSKYIPGLKKVHISYLGLRQRTFVSLSHCFTVFNSLPQESSLTRCLSPLPVFMPSLANRDASLPFKYLYTCNGLSTMVAGPSRTSADVWEEKKNICVSVSRSVCHNVCVGVCLRGRERQMLAAPSDGCILTKSNALRSPVLMELTRTEDVKGHLITHVCLKMPPICLLLLLKIFNRTVNKKG